MLRLSASSYFSYTPNSLPVEVEVEHIQERVATSNQDSSQSSRKELLPAVVGGKVRLHTQGVARFARTLLLLLQDYKDKDHRHHIQVQEIEDLAVEGTQVKVEVEDSQVYGIKTLPSCVRRSYVPE